MDTWCRLAWVTGLTDSMRINRSKMCNKCAGSLKPGIAKRRHLDQVCSYDRRYSMAGDCSPLTRHPPQLELCGVCEIAMLTKGRSVCIKPLPGYAKFWTKAYQMRETSHKQNLPKRDGKIEDNKNAKRNTAVCNRLVAL